MSYADEPEPEILRRWNIPPPTQKIRGNSFGGTKLVPDENPFYRLLDPLYMRGHPSRRVYHTVGMRLSLGDQP